MENLKRNEYQIMYNSGSPVPVGTSGKLPDYVTYNNILGYYFKIRFLEEYHFLLPSITLQVQIWSIILYLMILNFS